MLILTGIALALLGVLATVIPLSRSTRWWVRMLDFPRAQVAAILAVSLTLLLVALLQAYLAGLHRPYSWIVLALVVVALAYQLFRMRPYSIFSATQVPSLRNSDGASHVRLLVSNVLQSNRNFTALLNLIRESDPDLIFLVECDHAWVRALDVLRESHPHTILLPQENGYGLAFFSRVPLERAESRFLRDEEIPSVKATLLIDGNRRVHCYGLHPAPPVPDYAEETDQRDAELLVVAKEIRGMGEPVLVFGDLNDVAWSPTTTLFQAVSGLLDPRVGRGQFNTFHAQWPLLRYPLDHVFVSAHFELRHLRRLRDIGSDHFPILADLSLLPRAVAQPEGAGDSPEASPEDIAEANERIAQANEKVEQQRLAVGDHYLAC